MSTAPRPAGVTAAFILLFVSGILGVVLGIVLIVETAILISADLGGTGSASAGCIALAVVAIVTGALSIVFAFGVRCGSRTARLIVTGLQVLGIGYGVVQQVTGAVGLWSFLIGVVISAAIIALLWVGARTNAYFRRR